MSPGLRCLLAAMLAAMLPALAPAQDLASFEKRITTKKLANGLTVVVCERHEAPVFSFFTHVNVGATQEVMGITGIAHMFEHMAFKGNDTVGTTDYAAEKKALDAVEVAYAAYRDEKTRAGGGDAAKVTTLEKAWKDAIAKADEYVVSNQYDEILEVNGATGLNAFTNSDETAYFYSLPANRLELWAYMESGRFLSPVMREFYKERDVVMEERRMSESNPIGRLIIEFQAASFDAHPYGRPVIGWMSDLQNFSASQARKFYDENYVPANMVVTLVGDVKAADAIALVEKYFGRIPKRPLPPALWTVEPPQKAEKVVTLHDESQPFYIEAYHKGSSLDPDDAVFQAVSDILSNGRVSRLYRSLVRDKKIAAAAAGFPGFPGEKYPNLFAFFAVPTPGHTTDECRDAIRSEIERLKSEDVSDEELHMVKTRSKADLIRRLGDNQGLAFQLGSYQALHGDWRELFRSVDKIDKVTKADIRRVAAAVFTEQNRTVGQIVTTKADAGTDAGAEEGTK